MLQSNDLLLFFVLLSSFWSSKHAGYTICLGRVWIMESTHNSWPSLLLWKGGTRLSFWGVLVHVWHYGSMPWCERCALGSHWRRLSTGKNLLTWLWTTVLWLRPLCAISSTTSSGIVFITYTCCFPCTKVASLLRQEQASNGTRNLSFAQDCSCLQQVRRILELFLMMPPPPPLRTKAMR